MASYAALVIKSIMMHQIRREDQNSPDRFRVHLTDEPIELSLDDLSFLTWRFVKVLSGRGMSVVEDRTLTSPIPGDVRAIWSDGESFIEKSKNVARHLASIQPGSAAEGLLVVALASVGPDELVLISKVEHQEAMRLEPVTNQAGHQVFEVERIRDLVFGDTARIYKIGVISKGQSSTGVLTGELVDDQNGNQFADYFLARFLGMKLREAPAVLTERFLDTFTKAVNASTMTTEEKLDAHSSIVTELKSNSNRLNPENFIRDHIAHGHGSEVHSLAQDLGATFAPFAKDTARIDSHLRRLRMELSNGILVISPPEELADGGAVSVVSGPEGQDLITIFGTKVVSVRPTGGRL
ncbi:MAG: nucleoid-associated protein [Microbacteriaceae bacterium]